MALSTQTFTDIPLTNGRVLVEPENSIAFDYGAG